MKQNYIALVRSDVFVDLFKFGSMSLNKELVFDGDVYRLKDNDFAFANFTLELNPYDYTTEYLVLHYLGEGNKCVKIEDLQAVYALDEEAQKKLSVHYDPRIRLQVSPWADKFKQRQIDTHINQSYKGVENVWKIFDLSDEDRKKCDSIVGRDVVAEVFRELYDNKRPSGDLSPFVYLLRYERHSLYYKDKRGFFSDFVHIYLNCTEKEELDIDVTEKTDIGKKVDEAPENSGIFQLYNIVEALNEKCKEIVPECAFYKVGPLFLYMKQLCGKGLVMDEEISTVVNHYKNTPVLEFSLAAYLLGITLGYDGTYDYYYDAIGLKIFQDPVVKKGGESEPPFLENNGGDAEKLGPETTLESTKQQTEKVEKLPADEVKKEEQKAATECSSEQSAELGAKQDGFNSSAAVKLQPSTELFPDENQPEADMSKNKTSTRGKKQTGHSKNK